MLPGAFLALLALLSYPFGKLSQRRSRVALTCWGSAIRGLGTMSLDLWSPEVFARPMVYLGIRSAVMLVPSLILAIDLPGPASKGARWGLGCRGLTRLHLRPAGRHRRRAAHRRERLGVRARVRGRGALRAALRRARAADVAPARTVGADDSSGFAGCGA
jgi:hypothetical protein